MDNLVKTTYTLYTDTIELLTQESKENAIIVETPPHETYDIVQILYAIAQYRITGESSDRTIKVKIAELNKLSCEATQGNLTYTGFTAINSPDMLDILDAIQSEIETQINSINIEHQFISARKSSQAKYGTMFKKPLIYSCFGFDNIK